MVKPDGEPDVEADGETRDGETRDSKPEIVKPEIVKPEMVKPEMVKPEMVKQEMVKPEFVVKVDKSFGGDMMNVLLMHICVVAPDMMMRLMNVMYLIGALVLTYLHATICQH